MPPGFLIALREFFIKVITLPSLRVRKYHPGTEGAQPSLTAAGVRRPRPWAAPLCLPGHQFEPSARPQHHPASSVTFSLDHDVPEGIPPSVQSPPNRKRLSSDTPGPGDAPNTTLSLPWSYLPFYIYLCNPLMDACLPSSCPKF